MAKRTIVKPGAGGVEEVEDTTPAKTDEEAMAGFPGTSGDPTGGKTVKVMVAGKEMEVDEETAQILKQQNDFYESEMSKIRRSASAEPAAPRSADPTPKVDEIDPLEGMDTLLFADPKAALKKYGEHIEASVTNKLTNAYTQEKLQTDFWNSFYSDFKELRKHDATVRQTLAENMNVLAPMKSQDAAKELAKMSRDKLLGIAREFAPSGGETEREEVVLEGTAPTNAKRKTEIEAPRTLTGLIKSRRAARRAAATAQ